MSCLTATTARAFEAITLLPAEQILQTVEAIRHNPPAHALPLHDLAIAPLRRIVRGRHGDAGSHETAGIPRAVQHVVEALYVIAMAPSLHGVSLKPGIYNRLWYVLAALLDDSVPLSVPVHPFARTLMREMLQNLPEPQPLPETLPHSSRDLAQAVIAARLFGTQQFPRSVMADIARSPWAAADVMITGGVYPELYQSVVTDPWNAHRLLLSGFLASPRLIAVIATRGGAAARILQARPDIADPVLVKGLANAVQRFQESPQRVLDVLNDRPDLLHEPLLQQALARDPWVALRALHTHPVLRSSDIVIGGLARHDAAVRDALCRIPEVRSSDVLITALASQPWKAMDVLRDAPELRTNRTLRHAVCLHEACLIRLLESVPDIPNPDQFIARLAQTPRSAARALHALGPHPQWWRAVPPETRRRIARSHDVPSDVIEWLDVVATRSVRGEPEWTAADVQFVQHAPTWVQQMVRWMPAITQHGTDEPERPAVGA